MEFRVARAARITGEMLERLVREGLKQAKVKEPNCVICYGTGYSGNVSSLNSLCTHSNKMQQGILLSNSLKDEALRILSPDDVKKISNRPSPSNKLIARKIKHAKGKDIRVCESPRQVILALIKHREFFTPLVESDTEYRVWVYRKRILAVYEKRLTEPENNKKFGRNRANGWTFHALTSEDIPESVRRVSIAAVAALNLDFGAVDVLGRWDDEAHTDVHPTVLEVNSAPGVSDEHRTAIVKLAHRIVKWCENGCPARS